ncbi:hypothetical protein ACFL1T_04010 [Chlamydiota bacterium]
MKGVTRLSVCFFLLFVTLFSFLSLSCTKPSFPQNRIVESIKDLCKTEYGLDVSVRIIGKTLVAFIQFDSIFNMKEGIDEETKDKIGNLLLSVTRVSISTDASFEFYVVVAEDKRIPGMELVCIRYIQDIRRFLLGNISINDFGERFLFKTRFNPRRLIRREIITFFSDLSSGDNRKVLTKYLRKLKDDKENLLSFLRIILEMRKKEFQHYKIQTIRMKEIADKIFYVYCKTQETYKQKKEFSKEDFTFPEKFLNEYLFEVGVQNISVEIQEIVPLYYRDKDIIKKKTVSQKFQKAGDYTEWSTDDLFFEEIVLEDFVAGQIAQRVTREVKRIEDEFSKKITTEESEKSVVKTKEKGESPFSFKLNGVAGAYERRNSHEKCFTLDFKLSKSAKENVIPQDLIEIALSVTQQTVKKYSINDFNKVILSCDPSKKTIRSFSKEALNAIEL